jgi:rRNA maturation RNase YbeY
MISFVAVGDAPLPGERRKLRQWLQKIASDYGVLSLELSYAFGSSSWIAELNARHLGHEGDTDILTFDYAEQPLAQGSAVGMDRALLPFGRTVIQGECCISPSRVKAQSKEWGNSLQEEMRRVLVHGLLHLIGFDDKKPEDQKRMREAEDKALAIFASL